MAKREAGVLSMPFSFFDTKLRMLKPATEGVYLKVITCNDGKMGRFPEEKYLTFADAVRDVVDE